MPETTFQDPLRRSGTKISLEINFAILVCLPSILGNVKVIYVINKFPEMQTITNVLIANLALTDVLVAALNTPF